jgi:hypothetical protein
MALEHDESEELEDEGEDLKMTIVLTWKEGPEYFSGELPGAKPRAEEMAEYLNESFASNCDDMTSLLHEFDGQYDVKVEPLPEGEI